jgi:DNA-binding Lrp family transcriptional regulator
VPDENERPESQFDQLDRRLIAELRNDPRMAYASLGTRLGVTGMTVANRLQRLRQSGLLRIRALPSLREAGLQTEILGLVQVDVGALDPTINVLRGSPFVLRIDRVTGEFDIAFEAAFPSEAGMGALVREIQSVEGVRRLVVHHRLETVKDDDGWSAVWAEAGRRPEPAAFEVAPGTAIPAHLEGAVALAANWVDALAAADAPRLRALSTSDVVFTILPPHRSAGTFEGIEGVERQAERTKRAYNKLWYRIVGVSEPNGPFQVVIDALSPVEDHKGRVSTAFSRMAFAFEEGKVKRVLSLGEMELPEVPAGGEPVEAGRRG